MGYLHDFLEHVSESFSNLFHLDPDPDLSEPENVEKVIDQTGTVAAIVSMLLPIPAGDFLVLTPIQAKMALHIGRIKGFEVTQERAQEIVTEVLGVLGMTLTANLVIVSVSKLIPLVGGLLTVPLIYAATWGIGKVVDYYFDCLRAGSAPSSDTMKDLFAEQFKVGKRRAQDLDRDDLQQRADELRRKVEARDADLRTETRFEGQASAAGPAESPAASAAEGRQKIRITLPDKGEEERNAAVDAADLPPPMRKTIGPLGEVRVVPKGQAPAPEEPSGPAEPAPTHAKKTVGSATPPAGTEVIEEAAARETAESGPATEPGSLIDRLERLARLREAGILSEDEFAEAKRKLLS